MNTGSFMQILKPELSARILSVAEDEFFTHGYRSVSMREIARKSGLSVGNLYHYFEDKDTLFENVVGLAYDTFMQMIRSEQPHAGQTLQEATMLVQVQARQIAQLVSDYHKPLTILLFGSSGSAYEKTRDELVESFTRHIQDELVQYAYNRHEAVDVSLARPLAAGFLEGYFEIIRSNTDPDRVYELAEKYLTIYLPIIYQMV